MSGVPYQVPITYMIKEHHRASSPHLLGQVGIGGGASDSHQSCHHSCVSCYDSRRQQATSPKQLSLGLAPGIPRFSSKTPPLGSTQST